MNNTYVRGANQENSALRTFMRRLVVPLSDALLLWLKLCSHAALARANPQHMLTQHALTHTRKDRQMQLVTHWAGVLQAFILPV